MSDDCGYNPEWWKEEKAASLARKQRVASTSEVQPGDAFLIVTEGTVAEPEYFRQLRAELQLSTVWIQVRAGDTSDPGAVIQTAAREAKALKQRARRGTLGLSEPEKFDHVWAVVDTDKALQEGRWHDVVRLAVTHKVKLVPSTPCFEFWLLLHLNYTTRADLVDGDKAKHVLKHTLGQDYSTHAAATKKAIAELLPKWPGAVANAERVLQYHQGAATPSPANPSTEVGRLVTAMNDVAPEHLRKLRARCER